MNAELTVNNLCQGRLYRTPTGVLPAPGLCLAIRTAALSKYTHYAWVIYFSITRHGGNREAAAAEDRWEGSLWRFPETLSSCPYPIQSSKSPLLARLFIYKSAPALRAYDNPKSKAPSAHFMQMPPPSPPSPTCCDSRLPFGAETGDVERERSRINYQAAGI